MISFIVIALYFFAVVLDFVPLIKKGRKKKEISVYAVILTISFVVIFAESLGLRIPRISPIMEKFARKIVRK